MHQSLIVTITLITLCGFASALKFPMMGGNIIYPHRPQLEDTTASDNEKRSYEELERRREMWERKIEARAQLEERGLFDWLDGLFDSSANCYVKGYPSFGGSCASTSSPYIRSPSGGVTSAENAYISARKATAFGAYSKWLKNMAIPGMPTPSTSNMPKVAIAFSGGGLRAMLSGAGIFDGLDSRSTIAKPNLNDGKPTVNGLLDWASYMTGLSGGSWLIGASAQNNYATIDTLRSKIWKKPQIIPALSDFGFSFANMASDFARKNAAFPDLTSLVDIWSWFIGYGLISRGQSPAKTLFRDILTKSAYQSSQMPFPIVVMNQRAAGSLYNAQDPDVPIVEVTPYEFGDWSTRGFIKTEMMSTIFQSATSTWKCMTNFGLTQWILGASSAVFPGALPQIDASQQAIVQAIQEAKSSPFTRIALNVVSGIAPGLGKLIQEGGNLSEVYQGLGNMGLLTSNMYNPWNFAPGGQVVGNPSAAAGPILRLNDGGMDWQNIPIAPLLYRGVDVIIANDNSGDTVNMWPNGTALYMTSQWAKKQNLPFPNVPSPDVMLAQGLNSKPAFYGCNSTSGAPLIVWIPAAAGIVGADGVVNIDTVTLSVDQGLVPTFIANGNANILRGSGTLAANSVPSNWPQCVACAVMQRQLAKLGNGTMPAVCRTCFSALCYS